MTRDAIQLNPDKVKFYIARSGLHIKQLADQMKMTVKTVHRIKAGKNTTTATALRLATKLGTTVDALSSPVQDADMNGFLPERWVYDEAVPSGKQMLPFWALIGEHRYCVDLSPVDINNPIERLLKFDTRDSRKIVLRREDQAFIVEIHYFGYSGSAHETVYGKATACRCFPLVRNGDKFSKTELDALLSQYVWNSLKEKALDNAEVVSIEGHDYPEDPRAYLILVRFSRGIAVRRVALGARIFVSQYDLRESLLAYLKDLPAQRVQARPTETGVAITVKPERPAIFNLEWQSDEVEFKVNLAWRMPDGTLALAPWRKTSREKFITAIGSRNWRDMQLEFMPLRFFSQDDADEDADPPLFEADQSLSAESLAAIDARDYPALF